MDLVSLTAEFEQLLNNGETALITLSGDCMVTNGSENAIQVARCADLLAYFDAMDSHLALAGCEQQGNRLACTAAEDNWWAAESIVNTLAYDELAFEMDGNGQVQQIALTLSAGSELVVNQLAGILADWHSSSAAETAGTVIAPEGQIIYDAASARAFPDLFDDAMVHYGEFEQLFNYAERYYRSGAYEEAILVYEEMLEMDLPTEERIRILGNHAGTNAQIGSYEAAIESYLQIITIDPENATILNNICWDYGLIEQPEEALPYCEEAVKLDSAPFILDSRALTYGQLGDFDAAIADFLPLIAELEASEDPADLAAAEQRRAWIAAMESGENPFTPEEMALLRGDEQAEESMAADTEQQNVDQQDHHALGLQYLSDGAFEGAIAELSLAIEQAPQEPQLYADRASAYLLVERYEEMMADLDQAIALGTEEGMIYLLRGTFLTFFGESDQAISDLETALELGLPDGPRQEAESMLEDLRQ